MELEEVPGCKEGLDEGGSGMVGHLTRSADKIKLEVSHLRP
jgi:hypothetical protein